MTDALDARSRRVPFPVDESSDVLQLAASPVPSSLPADHLTTNQMPSFGIVMRC
jgi:hypothetical protein